MKILIDIEDILVPNYEAHDMMMDIKLGLEAYHFIVNSIEDITNANLRPTDSTPRAENATEGESIA